MIPATSKRVAQKVHLSKFYMENTQQIKNTQTRIFQEISVFNSVLNFHMDLKLILWKKYSKQLLHKYILKIYIFHIPMSFTTAHHFTYAIIYDVYIIPHNSCMESLFFVMYVLNKFKVLRMSYHQPTLINYQITIAITHYFCS